MMSSSRKLLFVVAIVAACFICTQARTVNVLTSQNYDTLTTQGKWLVDFFAPWCPHCQQLEPVFEESASAISSQIPGVHFGSVDCTVESDLCTRLNIEGYPTLKYIRSGIVSEYEGGRDIGDFISWAKTISGPATIKLKDESSINKFRGVADVTFVLYSRDEADIKAYDSVAQIYQDTLRFGITKSDQLVQKGKFKVTWFSDGEPQHLDGEAGELNADTLQHWVLARKYPHFVEFDANSWKHFASLGRPLVIAVAPKHLDKKSGLLRILSTVATQNTHYIFGRLDSDRYESFASAYVERSVRPTFFVMDTHKQVYWSNSSIPHEKKAIEAYLDGITSGTIPSTSTAVSGVYRMFNQIANFLGDILEDPLSLGAVVILFIVIVLTAVYFLTSVSGDEPTAPAQHKASVTIEKPVADRPGKVKAE